MHLVRSFIDSHEVDPIFVKQMLDALAHTAELQEFAITNDSVDGSAESGGTFHLSGIQMSYNQTLIESIPSKIMFIKKK